MKPIRLMLKAGERLYVNGAVLRFDRKATVEIMNDVVFLLENHVLQPEETTTALRQLYFVLQSMLIEPSTAEHARTLYGQQMPRLLQTFSDPKIREGLARVDEHIGQNRAFDAMKIVRSLFPIEAEILAGNRDHNSANAAICAA